jgi:AraC-like DNA-binding protein
MDIHPSGLGLEIPSDLSMIDSFPTWKDFVRDNFPWLEVGSRSKDNFAAQVSSWRLGSSALATIRSMNTEVTRTAHLASRSDAGYVKLMWQVAGAMEIEQDRRRSIIQPGHACVCDTARPYRVGLADGSQFAVLTLPYEALPGWERISQKLCGAPLADVVTARAALGALMALLRTPPGSDNEGSDNVLRAIQWMLSASLHRSASQAGTEDRNASRLNKAQQHILQHIDDPNLNPDEIAAALHMSRRALYLLFKEYKMTPARMIHDLRLERCQKALADQAQRGRSITEIAFDHGFADCATFSRLFKGQYGMSPSEWRAQSLQAYPVDPSELN